MGYAIAEAALEAGHDVTLISGPVTLERAARRAIDFRFDQRRNVRSSPSACGPVATSASCAPRSPITSRRTFRDKNQKARREVFARTDSDARHSRLVGHKQDRQFLLVGFAAETDDVEENARKSCAKRIATSSLRTMSAAQFGNGKRRKRSHDFLSRWRKRKISRAPKKIIARELVKIFSKFREKMFDKKNVMIN